MPCMEVTAPNCGDSPRSPAPRERRSWAVPQVAEGGGTGPGRPSRERPLGGMGGGPGRGQCPCSRDQPRGSRGNRELEGPCASPPEPGSPRPTVSARGGARGAQLGAQGAPAARSRGGGGSGVGGRRARGGAAGWGRCGAAPSGRAPVQLAGRPRLPRASCAASPRTPPPGGAGWGRPQSGQRRWALPGCAGDGDSTVPLGPAGTCTRVSPEACRRPPVLQSRCAFLPSLPAPRPPPCSPARSARPCPARGQELGLGAVRVRGAEAQECDGGVGGWPRLHVPPWQRALTQRLCNWAPAAHAGPLLQPWG